MSGRVRAIAASTLAFGLATTALACRAPVVFETPPVEGSDSSGKREPWKDRDFTCGDADAGMAAPEGDWDGWTEERAFYPSRSGRLQLRMPTSSRDEGWVLFGDSAPLAPPREDEVCYPACSFAKELNGAVPVLLEGFRYPARFASETIPERERLEFEVHAPWEAWCERQKPIPFRQGHLCAPVDAVTVDDEGRCVDAEGKPGTTSDCCREILCNQVQVCVCDQDGCRASGKRAILELVVFPTVGQMIGELDTGGLFLLNRVPPEATDGGAGEGGGPEITGGDLQAPMPPRDVGATDAR